MSRPASGAHPASYQEHRGVKPAGDPVHPCGAMLNLLKPTGHVMHQQFNIQQLYVLPTLYLFVLYLSENKQRLVPLTAQTDWFL